MIRKKIALSLVLTTTMAVANETMLPTINIIGDGVSSLSKIAGSTTLITQETLEETQPLSLQDALKKTPGIHAVETDGYGFYPRITIRGIGSDMSKKVLLLEDGAPIALGPYTDPAAYYHPPVERMERIEVLKGSGSLAHGPSTIGGAINYVTKQPKDGAAVVFGAGNFGYKSLLAEYGVVVDNYSFSVSALKKEGDGWRDMPFNATDVVVKGAVALNDNNIIGVKLTHYEHDASHTYLGLTQKEYETNYKQNKAKNDMMFIERDSIDLTHEYMGDDFSVKTLAYYNKAVRDWWRESFTFNAGTGENTMNGNADGRLREFEVMGLDSRLSLDYAFLGIDNQLDTGVRFHNEEMSNQRVRALASYIYEVDTSYTAGNYLNGYREDDKRIANALAFFMENRFQITDATSLTPGFRIESYEQKREINTWNGAVVGTTTKTDNTEFIPGIGITHAINQDTTLFAGVHKGFAPPRVQDAVSNSGDAVELDAERSTNYEIGVRGNSEKLNYEFTLFRLDFKNQIVQASQSGGAGTQNTNAGATLNQGAEISADYAFDAGFHVGGNYTYLETAKLNSTRILGGVDRNGNRLTYAPKHLVNLMAGYKEKTWGTGIGYSYVSEQFADLQNTVSPSADGKVGIIPSYSLWDFNAWYVVNKNAKLNLALKNLTDEKYIASRAPEGIMPGMGMNAQASLKISF